MMKKTTNSAVIAVASVVFATACGPNQRILQSANENNAAAAPAPVAVNSNSAPSGPTFDQDLNAMRTADFKFIMVFRRKDGAVLDADDKKYLSETIPVEINRRRLSDGGRAVIIGSNFNLPPETMDMLRQRFAVEDLSGAG